METPTDDAPGLQDWFPVEKFAERHATLMNVRRLRHILRNRGTNGLGPAVRRFGNQIYISETRFAAWFAGGAGK